MSSEEHKGNLKNYALLAAGLTLTAVAIKKGPEIYESVAEKIRKIRTDNFIKRRRKFDYC
ncbi:MAG: hypothetical protein GTN76_01255 [Candidatus Aenigmarchaeota archaeon]|nr:hypothetical protein [Candidatus Aenigmarchaeota archaeon]